MSKVLAWHKFYDDVDWFKASKYEDKEIQSIRDPEGGNDIMLPTAIPSPFARYDLVRNAFHNIRKTPELKAYTREGEVIAGLEDEKLVSDCLDVAEFVFNIDSFSDTVRIIAWDPKTHLESLKNGIPEHNRLGHTLDLYMTQDRAAFNFAGIERLYFIEYNHGIIGGTSPVTLFAASGNDLSYAQVKTTTNDILFDGIYNPLYNRDEEFQLFLYSMFYSHPTLQSKLKEVWEYLKANEKILQAKKPKLFTRIKGLKNDSYLQNYEELKASDASGNFVEIFGVPIRKRKTGAINEMVKSSDFIIKSTKMPASLPAPLVLQDDFNKPLKYIQEQWDKNTKVPPYDDKPLSQRELPGQKVRYPYLTISDFLEPYLVQTVFPINRDKYFNGNLTVEGGKKNRGYLLPLTPLFFQFFDTTDLMRPMGNGKNMIDMVQGKDSVKVTLRIPIKDGREHIEFIRTYHSAANEHELPESGARVNKGYIVENQFGVTIFPFKRYRSERVEPYFRLQVIDRNVAGPLKPYEPEIKLYTNVDIYPLSDVKAKTRRSKQTGASTKYHMANGNFDYVQVNTGLTSGIIIPKWDDYVNGSRQFTFAIDFGTTNTHIEYKVDGEVKPFEVDEKDMQIAALFNPVEVDASFGGTGATALSELIDAEFMPHQVNRKTDYYFPTRTVISQNPGYNHGTEGDVFADFNIPFVYGKRVINHSDVHTNLKWARRDKENEQRVRKYFEKLMMMMRCKVVQNNGNLHATKLVWFYPSSMKQGRINALSGIISEYFESYFRTNNKPVGIAESVAPFYYYKDQVPGAGAHIPALSIDIGGGTTDVLVFKNNTARMFTSFKFAANTLFGDGFSDYSMNNGFAKKYVPYFSDILSKNENLRHLVGVLTEISAKNKSDDINSFLFSIENYRLIADKNIYSYNRILAKDEDMKILFLLLYGAIIYHIATLMKHKDFDIPGYIIFSGTGSKTLSIISDNNNSIAQFLSGIFEKVYDTKHSRSLIIVHEKAFPKEVTCKGGLMATDKELNVPINDIKIVGLNGTQFIENPPYSAITDETKNDVVKDVENFLDIFIELNKHMDYSGTFEVSPEAFKFLKTEAKLNLRDYLEEGIYRNSQLDGELNEDDHALEEPLFFYPLIGVINELSKHTAQLTSVK